MKSLAELQAIKNKVRANVEMREGEASTRIVVGMATCGIAAGARPVLSPSSKRLPGGSFLT